MVIRFQLSGDSSLLFWRSRTSMLRPLASDSPCRRSIGFHLLVSLDCFVLGSPCKCLVCFNVPVRSDVWRLIRRVRVLLAITQR